MKRRDLMKRLNEMAAELGLAIDITEGGSHTKVKLGDRQTVVPRHGEINEITAKAIIKQLTPEEE